MCDSVTRRNRESQIKQEIASKAINRTISMVAEVMGIDIPHAGTPSQRREILLHIIESRNLSLGP